MKAIFAAGCFWGVEIAFRKINGVNNVTVGYTGGYLENPTYDDVCTGSTGHAEAVLVDFDPQKVSYEELLDSFWKMHNPKTLNRQGPDIGEQYRSAIFYVDEEQKEKAQKSKENIEWAVTEITKAGEFYPAEEYHQRYFEKKGIDPTCHI
ncbi:MAG: peptide-methionine (S)-S-oxide reductase MsrA [Candidatus Pacebacteria bacterium]|nr:peptide-methionine (S)-S-oxide reductase MsrA [Candidatus Paceibacterota bacterium]